MFLLLFIDESADCVDQEYTDEYKEKLKKEQAEWIQLYFSVRQEKKKIER